MTAAALWGAGGGTVTLHETEHLGFSLVDTAEFLAAQLGDDCPAMVDRATVRGLVSELASDWVGVGVVFFDGSTVSVEFADTVGVDTVEVAGDTVRVAGVDRYGARHSHTARGCTILDAVGEWLELYGYCN